MHYSDRTDEEKKIIDYRIEFFKENGSIRSIILQDFSVYLYAYNIIDDKDFSYMVYNNIYSEQGKSIKRIFKIWFLEKKKENEIYKQYVPHPDEDWELSELSGFEYYMIKAGFSTTQQAKSLQHYLSYLNNFQESEGEKLKEFWTWYVGFCKERGRYIDTKKKTGTPDALKRLINTNKK